MKALFATLLVCVTLSVKSQSILGTWQLVKQSSCISSEIQMNEAEDSLLNDMKSRSGATASIIKFKEKGAGEQSTRILNKRKSADGKNFLYRFDGDALHILDKKSRTLTDSYMVDKISIDSLILSNASRACETKIFIKIRNPK